jgi:hypothetical protein
MKSDSSKVVLLFTSRTGFFHGERKRRNSSAASVLHNFLTFSFPRFNRFLNFSAKFTTVSRETGLQKAGTKKRNEWLCQNNVDPSLTV